MSSGLCQQLWSESPSPICYTTPYTPNHQSINQTSKQAIKQSIARAMLFLYQNTVAKKHQA